MDYEARSSGQWQGRPWLSRALRLLIFLVPISLSIVFSLVMARVFPPQRLGMNKWVWWVLVAAASTMVLMAVDRLARRLLPLTVLLKLTLVFPDQAPSRFGLAMRTGTTRQLERYVKLGAERDQRSVEVNSAEIMLELVAALGLHDRLTRGHCERVRAYTDLVIKELHIPERDANLLRWSALLHDVGKLKVPTEILTSDRRPTDEEWKVLATHPAQGMALTEALADWLGPWRRTIGEHHERWDGGGYPSGLKGEEIHLGARIVAVTDAFDVMTSARSYKKPIAVTAAREEIARCASTQFDPAVVRAFLNLGLGRLRLMLGPIAWISNIPLLGQTTLVAGTTSSVAAAAAAGALALGAPAGPLPTLPPPPARVQVVDVAAQTGVTATDITATGPQDQPLIVTVQGTASSAVTLTLTSNPEHAEVLISRQPSSSGDGTWTAELVIITSPGFTGTDSLSYEVCNASGVCSRGRVRIDIQGAGQAPETTTPPATTSTSSSTSTTSTTTTTPTPSTISTTVPPPATTIPPLGAAVTPVQPPTTTTTTPPTTTTVAATPTPGDDTGSGTEDQTLLVALSDLLVNDSDPNGDLLTITSVQDPIGGTATLMSTHVVFVPDPDLNGSAQFAYVVCDPGNLCAQATVVLTFAPVDDAPRPIDDDYGVVSGNILTVATPTGLLANDFEPDGSALTVVPGIDIQPTGTITLASNGAFLYIPAPLFTGQDVRTYTACDPGNSCSTATITITVSAAPPATDELYLSSTPLAGSTFGFDTAPAAVQNPEPDVDSDSKPGWTLKKDDQPLVWVHPVSVNTNLSGPVTLDLFSTRKNFESDKRISLAATLLVCDAGGANCSTLLQRSWTFDPWNVGGANTWTERQLVLGSLSTTIASGREIRLIVDVTHDTLWIALSGDRPSSLLLSR